MRSVRIWKERLGIRLRWILLVVFLIGVWIVMGSPARGEWYARAVYPYVSAVLSRISSWFPFSIGDCFIYGSVAGLLAYLVYGCARRRFGRTLRHVVEYLAWVYVWFYLAWGLNYYRKDFFARTEIPYVAFSAERFQSFLMAYTDSLNAAWVPVDTVDRETVRKVVRKGYQAMPERFGLLAPDAYLRPKPMLFSRLMSGVGVTGYIGPFFIEYHLNGQLLPIQYPATYAHELAHVLGISNEAEANLYSYWVCTNAAEPEIRLSGYLSLLPYVLGNAYAVMDEADFKAWSQKIRPEVKALYNEKVEYWHSLYNPWIGEAQETLYNFFLKGNKISSGTKNYSEVIALLIALRAIDD